MGEKPYPTERNGKDLRLNRAELLKSFYSQEHPAPSQSAGENTTAPTPRPGN
jgi:hypothetical protein